MNRGNVDYNQNGFTLIELLVVLAVIGVMVGTLVFFALPSSLKGEKAKAQQTFELMQQIRLRAIMQRQIFGLDKPEDENLLQVLVFDAGTSAPEALPPPPPKIEPDTEEEEDEKKKEPAPTAEERKSLAASLGLVGQAGLTSWKLAEGYDKIDFGEERIFFFMRQVDTDLAYRSEEIRSNIRDEIDAETEPELLPELVFFPDGKLSASGSVRLSTDAENVIYAFSWDTAGNFEIEKQ